MLKEIEKMVKKLRFIIGNGLDFVIKFRFIIAAILFISSISFELHGSSISNWNNFGVKELSSGKASKTINQFSNSETIDLVKEFENWITIPQRSDGTLIGVPRMIRTDEWLVQTPFFISQANTGNQFNNKLYGLSGQNMVLAYNAPVFDISVIGKPFNWGFLFLGPSRGLSWYWSLKLIGLFLLSFEFSMILTKKNKLLSIIGSFWITFTPSIQWWFMQHLGDIIFFSLALMVGVYQYLRQKKLLNKLLFSFLIGSSIIGFILVIYPAFQVPFAYVILLFVLIELINKKRENGFNKVDYFIIPLTLFWSVSIILFTLMRSKEDLQLILSTVYPGQRISVGGELSWSRISDIFMTILLPFKIPTHINQVEASNSVSLLPYILLTLPFVLKRKDIKNNIFPLFLTGFSLFLLFYTFIGIPEVFSKLSLFSFVTSSRSWQTLSVIGVFLSLWFISYIWDIIFLTRNKKASLLFIGIIITAGLLMLTIQTSDYLSFLGKKYLLAISLVYLIIFITTIFNFRKLLTLLLLPIILFSGAAVNPLVKGLGVITNKKLSQKIQVLVKKDKNALWLAENNLYNYPQMFGAKTINSVRFYPDIKLMSKLDPENKMENSWNRYSHMHMLLINSETEMSVGEAPDVLEVNLNLDDFKKIGGDFIITNRELSNQVSSNFKKIYADKDGNRIYQLITVNK
ncbi:hypothetical protein ACMZ6Z_05355 [Streptococcus pluranimalium]|uniref:DUF7657 domain-containing protein n=1 Tax=Streptococcus pluranimalium TaxID=82348 RepID=UPI0039FDBEC8